MPSAPEILNRRLQVVKWDFSGLLHPPAQAKVNDKIKSEPKGSHVGDLRSDVEQRDGHNSGVRTRTR